MDCADSLAKHPLIFIVQKFFSTGMPEPSQAATAATRGGGAVAAQCGQLLRIRATGRAHDGRVRM